MQGLKIIYSNEMELYALLYVCKMFYYLIYIYIIAILDLFSNIWHETTRDETSPTYLIWDETSRLESLGTDLQWDETSMNLYSQG